MASRPEPRFHLDPSTSTFRIEHHAWARPFSGFLPAIAGEWGVPAWAFYVSRGQAVSGVGVGDRGGQILELYSFNKACTRVEDEGFRTFLRIDGSPVAEPFRRAEGSGWAEALVVRPAEVCLEAVHDGAGVRVDVAYWTIPGRRTPGLVRHVTITDLTGSDRHLEAADGAPRVLPFGLGLHGIKTIPRHIEAMMTASLADRRTALYRLAQDPADDAAVASVGDAHFMRTWTSSGAASLVVDPVAVFGDLFAFDRARPFEDGGAEALQSVVHVARGRTPCGFAVWDGRLPANGSVRLVSVLGRCGPSGPALDGLDGAGAWDELRAENRRIVDRIADTAFTVSARPVFDAYCRQNHLDDVIRGGMPISIDGAGPIEYVFSHQNFDLERDYHDFVVTPTYLSQGMGHFRNTLQNRRNDVFFVPGSSDENLRTFFGLLQLDGYNPLEVHPQTWTLSDRGQAEDWAESLVTEPAPRHALLESLSSPFTLGELAMRLEEASGTSASRLSDAIADATRFLVPGEVGAVHAGFWIDHWHYLIDLLERHLAVFPDRIAATLLDPGHTWFDDPDVVVPRRDRYRLTAQGPRQHGAVVRDADKERAIAARSEPRHRARTAGGDVMRSTLAEKLLLIAATRLATLDPAGLGIEMEAGKPGWNDSLNGLPGLFGSGLSETIELHRLLRLLGEWLNGVDQAHVPVYDELADLLEGLEPLVGARRDAELSAFEYWDRATTLKEEYRERIRLGAAGSNRSIPIGWLRSLCRAAIAMIDQALAGGGRGDDGIPHTYFRATPVLGEEPGGPVATSFDVVPVEPFLEGAVHWMREFPEDAAGVHAAVRASDLYDRELGMYRSSVVMTGADPSLGRAVGAYPPGWLEHASIYTHMEYKYLLELLRSGLVEEFWEEAERCLVAFGDPAAYGRSPLEGSSFIVSSAHPDPSEHGRGYQPRLSGMTAEFVSMWLEAALGPEPFRVDGGVLIFAPEPRLPGRMFTDGPVARRMATTAGEEQLEFPAGTYACRAVAGAILRYENPERADTFGPDPVLPVHFEARFHDGATLSRDGSALAGEAAEALRSGRVAELVVRLHRRLPK